MKKNEQLYCFCKGPLGNWHPSDIRYCGYKFKSAEQLFMYLKAVTFKDTNSQEKILKVETAKEAKELGRQVKPFNLTHWNKVKEALMLTALYYKAIYDKEFFNILTAQENEGILFVECNPEDKIWAVGLSENDPKALDPHNWKGQNLLGKCITHLGNHLRAGNCELLFIIKDYTQKNNQIVEEDATDSI